MSLSDTNLEIFWALAANERFLLKVEEFLLNAGEADLQRMLNKLQQDAALALADHLMDPELASQPARTEDLQGLQRELSDADPEKLFETPGLMQSYKTVTVLRLQVLDDVERALALHGSEYAAEYGRFLARVKSPVPENPASTVSGLNSPSP